MSEGDPLVPKPGYRPDESDPDVLVPPGRLLRGRLQRRGATKEGILKAAKYDPQALP